MAVKLLNFGPAHNYTIRPGQKIDVDQLRNEKLKRAYCFVKGIKDVLKIDVKSYLVKKILLRPEFTAIALKSFNEYDCLFQIMSHPELKAKFQDKIDYEVWQKEIEVWRNSKIRHRYSPAKVPMISK